MPMDGNAASLIWYMAQQTTPFGADFLVLLIMGAVMFAIWKFNIPAAAAIPIFILLAYANWLLFQTTISLSIFLGSLVILGGIVFYGFTILLNR